ncbi:hypothetical protein PRIPAC_82644 [Pristionchus pacificus]|uniref:Uncharacterized protein n=1 Tax=Pristionchus pacificus TaxID=54126 RepID=A0A2A6C2X5_PRIPA|nr:hypothetical protein PRIPAC_82644 [Pristionchus pacificus]|eukprot:PDM72480.1 hypothetical protein PRIPAC_38914 [Pristionchus pacificus]
MSLDDTRVAELRSLLADDLTPYYDTYFNLLRWIQASPKASPWNLDHVLEVERGSHPIHKYWPDSRCGLSGVIPRCIVHIEQIVDHAVEA